MNPSEPNRNSQSLQKLTKFFGVALVFVAAGLIKLIWGTVKFIWRNGFGEFAASAVGLPPSVGSSSSQRPAIATAIERMGVVYVYADNGRQLYAVPSGNAPSDGLIGFTSTTVSVRRGAVVYVFDVQGRQASFYAA